MSTFDFTSIIDRRNTGSLKHDKYAGKDIIPLWVADMDFQSAPAILDALKAKVDHAVFGYTIPHEAPQQAVISYLQRQHQYEVEPSSLVWMPGLVPALNLICQALLEEGDAAMTCTPVYPPFLSAPKNAQRELITVPLKKDKFSWTLDFEAMEKAITPNTRLFILCSPHNPVGRVYSKAELTQLGDFCMKHDLILCSDEIHCDLILDEVAHTVTASISQELEKRTITLMAPSKTYNTPGLACAYLIITDSKIRNQIKNHIQGIITEINVMGYTACAAAYNKGEEWRQELLQNLRKNRDLVYQFIQKEMPKILIQPMQATYLAWLDVSALELDDPVAFFEEAGVGLSDGSFFGAPNYVRLNFGCPTDILQKGLDRMKKAYQIYENNVKV